MKRGFFGLLVLLMFAACGESFYFSETREFPDHGWIYADSLNFDVPIDDTLKRFDLMLDLKHSAEYPFQNVYLFIHTKLPSGKRLGKLLNVDLADKTGLWQGDCSSSNCSVQINLQENAYFNKTGNYQFTVKQYMRADTLEGIQSVGLRLRERTDVAK